MKFNLELIKTSETCPEQYDVKIKSTQVAYIRVRHGEVRVDVPDAGGDTIYAAGIAGDGAFEDEEREWYLERCKQAIELYYMQRIMEGT